MDGLDGPIELRSGGADEAEAVAAGLAAVLAAARRGQPPPTAREEGATAVALRGRGEDLATVVAALVNDLLANLDTHGAGLSAVRLDGLLRTADGYTAWGYLLGEPTAGARPLDLSLDGRPIVERAGGEVVLRVRLRRD